MVGKGADLEGAAHRVRELEQKAAELHLQAQQYNKEGKFKEAQAAYAEMHKLEDEATQLAKKVGCVACILGDPASANNPACSVDAEVIEQYDQLYRPVQWPVEPSSSAVQLLEDRAVGSIVASATADGAASGVHWIYDLDTLAKLDEQRKVEASEASTAARASAEARTTRELYGIHYGLEFLDPPQSPFYEYAVGRNSPYGEQMLALLRSLARERGLHCTQYAMTFSETFGEGFDGYRDVSTKGFLRNWERGLLPPNTGADDAQANCVARLAPLVAAFAGDARLMTMVQYATRTTQNTTKACAWACTGAAVLERILLRDVAMPQLPEANGSASASSTSGGSNGPLPQQPAQQEQAPVPEASSSGTAVAPGTQQQQEQQQGQGQGQQQKEQAVASPRGDNDHQVTPSAVSQSMPAISSTACNAPVAKAVLQTVEELRSPNGRFTAFGELAKEIADQLVLAYTHREWPVPEAVAKLGRNCHMPNALTTPLLVVMHAETVGRQQQRKLQWQRTMSKRITAQAAAAGVAAAEAAAANEPAVDVDEEAAASARQLYERAVRLALREGGCCASRAAYVGACIGALLGRQAVPQSWLDKYLAAKDVQEWAGAIAATRRAQAQ